VTLCEEIRQELVIMPKPLYHPVSYIIFYCWDFIELNSSDMDRDFGRIYTIYNVQTIWQPMLVCNCDIINCTKWIKLRIKISIRKQALRGTKQFSVQMLHVFREFINSSICGPNPNLQDLRTSSSCFWSVTMTKIFQ
jgi:hypothetical protein